MIRDRELRAPAGLQLPAEPGRAGAGVVAVDYADYNYQLALPRSFQPSPLRAGRAGTSRAEPAPPCVHGLSLSVRGPERPERDDVTR